MTAASCESVPLSFTDFSLHRCENTTFQIHFLKILYWVSVILKEKIKNTQMDKHKRDWGTHARCRSNRKFKQKSKHTQIISGCELWAVRSTRSYKWPSAQASDGECCMQKARQSLFKTLILEKLLSGPDLPIKFHNFTILLKYEAWNAEVLQAGVFLSWRNYFAYYGHELQKKQSHVHLDLFDHTNIYRKILYL